MREEGGGRGRDGGEREEDHEIIEWATHLDLGDRVDADVGEISCARHAPTRMHH